MTDFDWTALPPLPEGAILPQDPQDPGDTMRTTFEPTWKVPCQEGDVVVRWYRMEGQKTQACFDIQFFPRAPGAPRPRAVQVAAAKAARTTMLRGSNRGAVEQAIRRSGWRPLD